MAVIKVSIHFKPWAKHGRRCCRWNGRLFIAFIWEAIPARTASSYLPSYWYDTTRLCSRSISLSLSLSICFQNVLLARISVTSKQSPNVYKNLPKNDFTRKIKDFDNFTKIAQKCWQFGQNNCCHMLWKVAQSAINRQILSHWHVSTLPFVLPFLFYSLDNSFNTLRRHLSALWFPPPPRNPHWGKMDVFEI